MPFNPISAGGGGIHPPPGFSLATKNFDDVSIFEKIQNFDDFSGFCSPEFDSFVRDLAIFRLKCNEQHSSIPKSQKTSLATFS